MPGLPYFYGLYILFDKEYDILSPSMTEEAGSVKNRNYYTRFHMIMEILSWIFLLAALILAVVGCFTLEGPVPIHYDGRGNPDGYGSPASLLLMPIVMMFASGGVSAVGHFLDPSAWNMPFKVNYLRRHIVYRDMMSMLFMMELELAIFTLAFTLMSYFQNMHGIGLISVLFVVALMGTIVFWSVIAYRHNKM